MGRYPPETYRPIASGCRGPVSSRSVVHPCAAGGVLERAEHRTGDPAPPGGRHHVHALHLGDAVPQRAQGAAAQRRPVVVPGHHDDADVGRRRVRAGLVLAVVPRPDLGLLRLGQPLDVRVVPGDLLHAHAVILAVAAARPVPGPGCARTVTGTDSDEGAPCRSTANCPHPRGRTTCSR